MGETNIRTKIISENGSYKAEEKLKYRVDEFLKDYNINSYDLIDIKYSIAYFCGTNFQYSVMIIYKIS